MKETTCSLTQLHRKGPLFDQAAVAVGNFDGVHRGHVRVLDGAVQRARQGGAKAVALTFDPHPRAVVMGSAPPSLAMPSQRRELLADIGLDALVTLRFDRELAALSPEQFVQEALVQGLGARHVVVGEDFRFGHRAQGTPGTLLELGRKYGFTVQTVAAVKEGEAVISSSAIRRALAAGDAAEAARLLGRPYEIRGVVVRGDGRGASLGYATANVEPPAGLQLPGHGVYAARAAGRPAVAVVGDKPTFGGGKTVVEVHILDFEGDLYDQLLAVAFLERLRPVEKFSDVEGLKAQMAADAAAVRERFSAPQGPASVGESL